MRATEKGTEFLRKWGSAWRDRAGAREVEGQVVEVHLVFSLGLSDSAELISLLWLTPFLYHCLPARHQGLDAWPQELGRAPLPDTPVAGG